MWNNVPQTFNYECYDEYASGEGVVLCEFSSLLLASYANDGTILAKSDLTHKLEHIPVDNTTTNEPSDIIACGDHAVIQPVITPANMCRVTFRHMVKRFFDNLIYKNDSITCYIRQV